ncbi:MULTISPECIES: hypothetical protein [unclassified Variovorax]|uniref:hypothetical protein n=1 Tax=unclassified Variovorax TaxID=663243 RepID=UPI003ECD3040
MKTPAIINERFAEKMELRPWASVHEGRIVSQEWRRQLGGRNMSAALTAAIKPAATFSFSVSADGIDDEYVAAAKNGVLTTLLAQSYVSVLACNVELSGFRDGGQDASYAAFFMVAKEATERLLGVFPGFKHNIDWGGGQL